MNTGPPMSSWPWGFKGQIHLIDDLGYTSSLPSLLTAPINMHTAPDYRHVQISQLKSWHIQYAKCQRKQKA